MKQRSLYIAIALIFLVSLLASTLVILTAEDAVLGPKDPLHDYLRIVDGKWQIVGGMPQALMQQALQRIFLPSAAVQLCEPLGSGEVCVPDGELHVGRVQSALQRCRPSQHA